MANMLAACEHTCRILSVGFPLFCGVEKLFHCTLATKKQKKKKITSFGQPTSLIAVTPQQICQMSFIYVRLNVSDLQIETPCQHQLFRLSKGQDKSNQLVMHTSLSPLCSHGSVSFELSLWLLAFHRLACITALLSALHVMLHDESA